MNQSFYSSLIINNIKFPGVHQVFRPRYNKEFFKRLFVNIEQLRVHLEKRGTNPRSISSTDYDLSKLKNDSNRIVKVRERLENAIKSGDQNFNSIMVELGDIEEQVMPFAITVPNRHSKQVPEQEVILENISSDFAAKQKLTKILSHTKLSYINSCYSKSVVGPNSHYYYGIGAKLQYGLANFFTSELENQNFVPVSGMSVVKSAVVEAVNSKDLKDFTTDPCRVLLNKPDYTTTHVVEASRESLVSFITTIGHRATNDPLRLVTNGAGYRMSSDFFDSGDRNVSQFETVHALSYAPSVEKCSMSEYHKFRNIVWNIYKKLELPTRLIQCSLDGMISNEYDASRIEVWLPSRQQWIQVARISHYLDYITVRVGMKRGHIIDCMVMDGQALVAAIIENNQTSMGKFIIPSTIRSHICHLTNDEQKNYFGKNQEQTDLGKVSTSIGRNTVFHNYESRRYLVKKNYVFAHSEKAYKESTHKRRRILLIGLIGILGVFVSVDWEEFYRLYYPGPEDDPKKDMYERRVEHLSLFFPRLAMRKKPHETEENQDSTGITTVAGRSSS